MRKYICITIASLFAFVACEKVSRVQEEPAPVDEPVVKELVTITASIPEEGLTKVTLTPDEEGATRTMKLAWETTDKITINGEEFTIDSESISVDGKSASFNGTEPEPIDGKFTIQYTKEPAGGFDAQEQTQDGTYDHLGYSVTLGDVTDYSNITFSSSWASANSATFTQGSVLWLRALLPAAVASSVKKVIFKASQAVFNGKETFTVTLGSAGVKSGDNKLDVYATIPSGTVTSGAMDLLVQFQVDADHEYDKYTAYREIPDGTNFGEAQYIGINCSNIESFANKSSTGIGESTANPYLIGDQHQMAYIPTAMISGMTYFKLVDDIDMTGISWTSLNNAGTYDKQVDFNGNEKTVSNLGGTMFYVFKGAAYNFTLYNPTITAGNKKGSFAQFIQGINNAVTNVDVNHVTTFAGSNGPCGGLVGLINSGSDGKTTATIVDCDITNVVVNADGSGGMAGGLIGSVEAKTVVTNCSYSGNTVANTYDYVGGLVGKATAEISITGCSVSNATISGRDAIGGLVGHCEAGGSVTSCSVNADINGRKFIGGIVGRESTASGKTFGISKSSFEKKGTGLYGTGQYVGGILGNKYGAGTVTIENCWVNSPIVSEDAWVGGISSNHYNGKMTIGKCYVMGSISALYGAGGIVGQVRVANLTINPCAVYVTSISATDTAETQHESSGTIVAYGYNVNVTIVRNCWYVQTLSFSECAGNSGSPSKWCPDRQDGLSNAKITGGSPHSKIYPYWGRYTDPSSWPLNKMCKDNLGFSSEDWNLDVNPPTLK